MNRNCYRLVFNKTLGMMVPVAETARRSGKSSQGKAASGSALALAGVLLASPALAGGPVACTPGACGAMIPGLYAPGQTRVSVGSPIDAPHITMVNQEGASAIGNFASFNVSAGHTVQFGQISNIDDITPVYVPGANFTFLGRIWDSNPSIIAGSISQAAGQKANVILVNSNGIAFMGGSQVNLNQFTASTLNIADEFITGSFLTSDSTKPQFEKSLDGDEGRGFIKVFEGARISAGNFGRVMLIAPTVVNKGTITAPDGQIIAAAASRVFLRSASGQDGNVRGLLVEVDSPASLNDFDTLNTSVKDGVLDGQTVSLTNAAEDKLGHVTNQGELSTPRGNVTMIGYAVNQQGIARATTSVVANGSVYLLAKDRATTNSESPRAGRVVLAAGSRTEVLFDLRKPVLDEAKLAQAVATGQLTQVQVDALRAEAAAVADGVAPSAAINAYLATGELTAAQMAAYLQGAKRPGDFVAGTSGPRYQDYFDATGSIDPRDKDGAPLRDASGALVMLERKSQVRALGQQVEMKGGAMVYAPSGEVAFIAQDNPGAESANDPFTNSGANLISNSARIHIADDAVIDVAGLEKVQVSAARNSVEIELRGDELKDSPVNQTGPLRGQKVYVDLNRALANANAGKSTLIAKDALESNLAKLERTVAERSTTGGTVSVKSQGEALLDSGALIDLSGGSVAFTAANQKTTLLTSGGKLIDIADADAETRYDGIATRFVKDYGRWNKQEVIDLGQSFRYDPGYEEGKNAGVLSVVGMKTTAMGAEVAGRTTTGTLQREAGIQPRGAGLKLGVGDVSGDYKLNQKIVIGATTPDDINTLALNPALFGQGKIANLEAFSNQAAEVREALRLPAGGSVSVTAKGVAVNADVVAQAGAVNFRAANNGIDQTAVPLDVTVAAGVTLSTAGGWANDLPTASGRQLDQAARVHGGTVTLKAVDAVTLGQGSLLDVGGGGRLKPDGKLLAGNGGVVTLDGNTVQLGGEVRGYALAKGGTYSIKTDRINIGGADDPTALNLDAGVFERGGFAGFNLTGASSISIADDTVLRPTNVSRELLSGYTLQQTGSDIGAFSRLVKREDRVRQAANVSFTSNSPSDPAQGTIRLGENAKILADDKATISFSARSRIDLLGEVKAAGGSIAANVNRGETTPFDPASAVWLGSQAVLDVSGAARTYADNRGLTKGAVLNGGSVTLGGQGAYVVTEAGSSIKLSGAAPVRLDVPNETGGLGRSIGSDAGSLTVTTSEGALLDGTIEAKAGSVANRGGTLDFALPGSDQASRSSNGAPLNARVLILAPTVASQAGGLAPGKAIPLDPNGNTLDTRLDAQALEAAGFDRMRFSSRDVMKFENGLDVGANRATPLRTLEFNAPRFETAGGDAALKAHSVRFANDAGGSPTEPVAGTGTLTTNANLVELAGNLSFSGMDKVVFNGEKIVRFAGLGSDLSGALKTASDLVFHGAVIAPATAVQYKIEATGRRVSFTRNTDAPTMPFAALGSLSVDAADIVQDGNLWAPFGQFNFKASNSLVFKDGSLTSVAATPGRLLPYGRIENGRQWVYGADGSDVDVKDLSQKSIRTEAASIDMQPGAKVVLAGGGDLQAYEFTVGPGGSRDILADKNTYAILPGLTGGFAPIDAQEGFDRASGETVYLAGVPNLADGFYTLLPAHYALLPGAYAVKLDTGIKNVMPGQAYSRQDGVRIAAGYVTDSREGAPRDALWQGIQVLTRDQVRARSEYTLTNASQYFSDSRNRPGDAGLLSIATTGIGADALKLDAIYNLTAGQGGRGAEVDISALSLAIVSGNPAGTDPDAVVLDVDKLNALGADSLLIGGTRSSGSDTTALAVGADNVTLANDAAHTLKAGEVMLAAKDTVTLKAGSAIDAQGEGGDAANYEIAGNGAFVRAASTRAGFSRTDSPDRSKGTLVGEAGSQITAADSIALDATLKNDYQGTISFKKNGATVAGNLGVGAARINFGAAATDAEGLTFTQAELDALDLRTLVLTSYSTFDLYGDVNVGRLIDGKPVLQNLTLQGAGLVGLANTGQTAQLNAQNLTLANPAAVAFTPGGELGNGNLAVTADTLTLGKGDKAIQGFGAVTITANELVGSGAGTLAVTAPVTLNVARISGERGADQAFHSTGALTVAQHTADRALAPVTTLGAKWALQGTSVDFDSRAELPSGAFKLTATEGDVELGANARVDVAGRTVRFFDVRKPSWGGTAEFVSDTGNVDFAEGANVDVSAAAGGDAGTLIVRAANGTFSLADGSVSGASSENAEAQRGEGARAVIDTGSLASFSALNTALNSGGFDGERDVRVRTGDVSIAATDTLKALNIRVAADGGKLDVAGTLDASDKDAGRIELFAKNDVNVLATAELKAVSSGAGEDGGDIEIGTRDGIVNLLASDTGKGINVAGGAGGQGGTVLLRAPRTANDVNIGALNSSGLGSARSVSVEAVKTYSNINTLTATGASSGTTLSLATLNADNTAFAANHTSFKSRLGKTGDPDFHILSGVEVRSTGDLTLSNDWNLATSRAGGEAGVLTLRADGNLKINSSLSDGFNVATPLSGTAPATLRSDDSWSYRLIAGADSTAANPLAVKPGDKDVMLAAGKLIRTGTGDIRIASGNDIKLGDNKSAIYTAGRLADPVSGFTVPTGPSGAVNFAQFSQGGGDVRLAALGDITSEKRSQQLYSNWLFRQGRLDDKGTYSVQPAWWVRFDQFQQGVGALGGGDVTFTAGGNVRNISASTPTQARMASATPDANALVKTGGGSVRVEAGGDLLGGQYYADNGEIVIRSGGKLDSGEKVGSGANAKPLYTILALGDAEARVRANGDANIQAMINPHLVVQASRNPGGLANNNIVAQSKFSDFEDPTFKWSVFSTYTEDSAVAVDSLGGNVVLHNNITSTTGSASLQSAYSSTSASSTLLNFGYSGANYNAGDALLTLPPSLSANAFQGDITVDGSGTLSLSPAPSADLSLLAAGSVNLRQKLVMSDTDPLPDASRPVIKTDDLRNAGLINPALSHAATPVHQNDIAPVRIYAVAGDVEGKANTLNLTLPKAVAVKAGQDVKNLGIKVQHVNAVNSVSRIEAGRDVLYTLPEKGGRAESSFVWVGGPGRLEVTAGRNVDLGASAGIVSRSNLDNTALPETGADIQVTAGVGANGVDYVGAVDRLIAQLESGNTDDATLWLARWLTGDDTLVTGDALAAVRAVDALSTETQRERVRTMLFTGLRTTGRDANKADSGFAGDFARGYPALELLFPGIEAKHSDGSFKNYQGNIDLSASRILTEVDGNIELLTPGGKIIAGLSNTPASLLKTQEPAPVTGLTDAGVLGIAAIGAGDVKGIARDDILVNQSRILTVGGGDVLLWSSEGDIDAGKGKKSAAVVPPPLILVDSQGNVTQVLQGAASGSGIGALQPAGGTAGNVDLIAPRGTVNAGDAGIRAGNLNIAAQVVLGADNISVSGSSAGTPVADTSAVSAASSGASNADGGVSNATTALSQGLSEAARAAEDLKQAFKPTFITAEVIGHGE